MSTMPPPTPPSDMTLPPGLNLQLLFGPMLIGVFLNTILYGVLVVQILYLFLVETLNTGFDIGIIYEPLVLRFGTINAVANIPVMLMSDPIVMVMISVPIQCFVGWRIYVISKSKLIIGIIGFFAFSSLAGAYSAAIGTSVTKSLTYQSLPRMSPAIITWLVSSATADIVITVSLVFHLYKRKTGVRSTDDIVNRIIRLTIQTGMVTALFAALDVIFFLALPSSSMNFLWDFPLSKLYTNSLLSTLNARSGWNNLVVDNNDNLLFGTEHSRFVAASRPTTGNTSKTYTNPQKIITGVYELGVPSTPGTSKSDRDEDLEQGINVTRVVEHLKDPMPRRGDKNTSYTQ
ncbi:hypothetical protein ONZ45_g12900 [Pleurotus djamor]|nr:hypothetical protein ONZ45_g12900 [Pleurotus djamor]